MGLDERTSKEGQASELRSMTGFASSGGALEEWQFTMDLRGVNGRGLDIRLRVPDWIEGFDVEARKRLQAAVGRGNLTLSIRITRNEAAQGLRLNYEALNGTLGTLHQIETAAEAAGITLSPMTAADVAGLRGVLDMSEDASDDAPRLRAALLDELDGLIAAFNSDRLREGAALYEILSRQINEIDKLRQTALDLLGDRSAAQRATLERNLAKLLDAGDMPDEARLAQELALIAVKTDVFEELDRLDAHVSAARALLSTSGPVGRKLDFLMQEFNREANTLCSKAQSSDLTKVGLDLKTVVDQMREQVQNVE